MKTPKISELRHRITFQKSVEVPDGYKGKKITWQDLIIVWAAVEPLSGREYFYSQQIKAEVTHRIRIRYNPDINTEMRIKHQDRILEIESIIDKEEKREFQEIFAREQK